MIKGIEAQTRLILRVHVIELLQLHPVELCHVVVLKNVEYALESSVEEVAFDLGLLILLDCGCIGETRWNRLHILVTCFDLL